MSGTTGQETDLRAETDRGPGPAHFPCPGAEHSTPGPFSLRDCLRRFDREAHHGTCDTGRYRCPYFVWGQGPPLLFIHGIASSARSFVPVISCLTDDFTCIAYTLPTGCGDGARLHHYHHGDLVADAVALLDRFGVSSTYIYASSFGATVGLAALRDHPRRFPSAVAQGGFARRELTIAEVQTASFLTHWRQPLRRVPIVSTLHGVIHRGYFRHSPPELWQFFLDCTGQVPLMALGHRALLLRELDLRADLPTIRQPLLLVRGEGDPVVDRPSAAELAQGLPNAREVEISRCGHSPEFSHPAILADLIGRFLKPCPAQPDLPSP